MSQQHETSLQNWIQDEQKAYALYILASQLIYQHSIELVFLRRSLIENMPSKILENHAKHIFFSGPA